MLKENLKTLRKNKGLSQQELSVKLNVVRQTISKWEQGLSVPDAEMLISISKEFDIPVSELLGKNISEKKENSLKEIAGKLEVINLQLAQRKEHKRKVWHFVFISICIIIMLIFIFLALLGNAYMEWDYNDPELAVLGVGIHAFIWIFVRIAPLIFIGSTIGVFSTRKNNKS